MTDTTKLAVVTGAASGIGRALARRLDADGWRLALTDVNAPGLEETRGMLRGEASLHTFDVADREAVHEFADELHERHQHVDLVVNNAGVDLAQSLADVSYEDFEWIFGINFWGVVHGTRAFLPRMLERHSGTIVNVSSVFGIVGWPMHGTYCAAKFAVRGFTETLRHELVGTGVRAVTVHPGGIKTNIVRNSRYHRDHGGAGKDKAVEIFDKIARTSAEEAADVIVDGVRKGKQRILIGADARVIDSVQRLAPEDYFGVMSRFAPRRRSKPKG